MKKLLVILVLTLLSSKAVAFTSPTLTDTENVESRDSKPRSATFNNDGTKFYIASASNKEINVYDLTTAWILLQLFINVQSPIGQPAILMQDI